MELFSLGACVINIAVYVTVEYEQMIVVLW